MVAEVRSFPLGMTKMNDRSPQRRLPNTSYVSLAEALTWIAFGESMALDELQTQVGGLPVHSTGQPKDRLRQFFVQEDEEGPDAPSCGYFYDRPLGLALLTDAWCQFRDKADRGTVKAQGRFTSSYSFADAHLADVVTLTGDTVRTFSQFDISTGGIRRQPEGTPDVLWWGHPFGFERELASFDKDVRSAEGYLLIEVKVEDIVRNWPNPEKTPRKSHAEVVGWCRLWIESGQGNGMDQAWRSFSEALEHEGLSRDDVFRPAWNEAKGRLNQR